jgi:hypothetical protein
MGFGLGCEDFRDGLIGLKEEATRSITELGRVSFKNRFGSG